MNLIFFANWAVDNLVAPIIVGIVLILFEHYFLVNKKTFKNLQKSP